MTDTYSTTTTCSANRSLQLRIPGGQEIREALSLIPRLLRRSREHTRQKDRARGRAGEAKIQAPARVLDPGSSRELPYVLVD